jgi:hypothetical protein
MGTDDGSLYYPSGHCKIHLLRKQTCQKQRPGGSEITANVRAGLLIGTAVHAVNSLDNSNVINLLHTIQTTGNSFWIMKMKVRETSWTSSPRMPALRRKSSPRAMNNVFSLFKLLKKM